MGHSPDPGPLHEAAIWIGRVGTRFHELAEAIEGVWLIGEHLAIPFRHVYVRCYWMAHYLYQADQRMESMDIDILLNSPGLWILVRCGADIGRAAYWQHAPWGWFIWKFRKEHPILDALIERDFTWIGNYVINRWPVLRAITEDPWDWVWDKIAYRWPDVSMIVNSPGMWLLVRAGADIGRAGYYQYRPWMWFIWKFRKEHPPLDALLDRDSEWLFDWILRCFRDYGERHLRRIVAIGAFLLRRIWDYRWY